MTSQAGSAYAPSAVLDTAAGVRAAAERARGDGVLAAVAEHLRTGFLDALGEPAPDSVQLFTTSAFGQLDVESRGLALLDGGLPDDDARFLVLRATAGSALGHRVIALPEGQEPVPALLAGLGFAAGAVVGGADRVSVAPADGDAGIVAFGGPLVDDQAFGVVVHSRLPVPPAAVADLTAVAVAVRTVLLERAISELRTEVALVDFLKAVGQRLTSQLDLDVLVQEATDAATQATRAAFGAFFYNLADEYGESYTLYSLSGIPKESFDGFPMPRNTAVFAPTFYGTGTVRSDDITGDPRYGKNAPHRGTPPGHLPVRSYLAVSVLSPTSGEVLGGFFFAHPEPGRFTARHEQLAEGIAGYAAIALDNARLFARQRNLATELARSMLPTTPDIPGLTIVSRYLPAAAGSEVGGDWFDVVELPAGRTGLVIGDVVGRGVGAATVMGQMRTAVRSYALLDMPPAQVIAHSCRLARTVAEHAFITCLYAVHDPADNTVTVSNAGHLPAVLLGPDGELGMIGEHLGMPLGVGEHYGEQTGPFLPGASLTLFTDGLVETRTRGLGEGIDELVGHLRALSGDLGEASDRLIDHLTGGRHDDDVAFLHVRTAATARPAAAIALDGHPRDVARARAFVTEHLTAWDIAHFTDAATLITSELVTNAILHATGPSRLRVHHDGARLVVDVADDATAWPQVHEAGPDEVDHRGLAIVRALATRWGTRTTASGKVVWVEIDDPG